jgi:hypothetical protein
MWETRYGCISRKERPTTAARLERVKFRWQNQAAAWAFTLWKGAVADAVQIQLNHEIDNLTEEMGVLKSDNAELKEKLQRMAYEGVEYLSDGDKEEVDHEHVEDTDVLAQQRVVLEKAIGKELLKLKEKQEGAVLQTVIAKMRYAQSRQSSLVANNTALARMLHRERNVSRASAISPSREAKPSGATFFWTSPHLSCSRCSAVMYIRRLRVSVSKLLLVVTLCRTPPRSSPLPLSHGRDGPWYEQELISKRSRGPFATAFARRPAGME